MVRRFGVERPLRLISAACLPPMQMEISPLQRPHRHLPREDSRRPRPCSRMHPESTERCVHVSFLCQTVWNNLIFVSSIHASAGNLIWDSHEAFDSDLTDRRMFMTGMNSLHKLLRRLPRARPRLRGSLEVREGLAQPAVSSECRSRRATSRCKKPRQLWEGESSVLHKIMIEARNQKPKTTCPKHNGARCRRDLQGAMLLLDEAADLFQQAGFAIARDREAVLGNLRSSV